MLELNAARVGKRGIAYRVVDAFALQPTHDRDVVFFGFFLSHVPPGRVEAFWRLVDGLLAPGGRVLFVDETDHGLWEEEWVDREADRPSTARGWDGAPSGEGPLATGEAPTAPHRARLDGGHPTRRPIPVGHRVTAGTLTWGRMISAHTVA